MDRVTITNYGGNVKFSPRHFYTPKSETEVLEILNNHKDGQIRVVASGHAWSEGIISNDALIDLKYLQNIDIKKEAGEIWVTAQGGTILKKLVDTINSKSTGTMPTLGGLMRQTIAGAISTGTHGTGSPSLSNFLEEIRLAAYDIKTGSAKIYQINSGDELLAARVALGCLGVILSVKFKAPKKYWIKEVTKKVGSLEEVLKRENEYPLQQFMFIPYSWIFVVQSRQVVSQEPDQSTKISMWFKRMWDIVSVELIPQFVLNILISLTAPNGERSKAIRFFFEKILPNGLREEEWLNLSTIGLTLHSLHHATFQHVETEIFIPEKNLKKSLELIKELTLWAAGLTDHLSESTLDSFKKAKLNPSDFKGFYQHHYLYFFRKVLPDQTLISMSAGNQNYYAVGVFTYLPEGKRQPYYKFSKLLSLILSQNLDARVHWGKYFPLEYKDVKDLYPNFAKFHQIAKQLDPKGVFRNTYTAEILGLK